ncbi:MAG: tetratricopeptide repeat protein [Rhodospirillales bacterium]|jgi:tetratricopeptide (TPR) repeat protein
MKETSKSIVRRLADMRYAMRFFVGQGIDIGAGSDPISLYAEQFPRMTGLRVWDMPDGDAQKLATIADASLDFVHSSHCLEHMVDPMAALQRWFDVLKPGGHMVLLFPDEDMYEQGIWPSNKNNDHKWTFAIYKKRSWSPKSLNVIEMVAKLSEAAELVKLEKLDASYRYNLPPLDQTLTPVGECAIEMVIRKRLPEEIAAGGRLPRKGTLSRAEIFSLTGINVGAAPAPAAAPASTTDTKLRQALALHQKNDLAAAEPLYREVMAADPKNFDAPHLLGIMRRQQGDSAAAIPLLERALEIIPRSSLAHMHLGNALRDLGRNAEARAHYDKAVEIDPKLAEAYYNRGYMALHEVDTHGALADFDKTIENEPTHAMANRFSGMVRLLHGDFARGWPQYEWRWRGENPADVLRDFGVPRWTGEADLKGKRILLHAEQGFGDTIQFVRYAPMVAARGAHVVLEVQPPLKRLVEGFAGVAELVVRGDTLPPVDFECPLLSLPLAFKTDIKTIPSSPAYLKADAALSAAWAKRLGPPKGRRIGYASTGQPRHTSDTYRSIPMRDFLNIVTPKDSFYCLQKELRPEDAALLDQHPEIPFFGPDLSDFADTAALMANLDLVITVDTSVAHLAASLGKPTWILLRYDTDWRWLQKRSDSPWYPSVRLFRQTNRGAWGNVLDEVAQALKASPKKQSSGKKSK